MSRQFRRILHVLQVADSTDLHKLFPLLRQVVSSHPKVLSGPELPIEYVADAEVSGFGESGVDILIEFWMEGIDDGEHRVGGDLYLMIWDALKETKLRSRSHNVRLKLLGLEKMLGSEISAIENDSHGV